MKEIKSNQIWLEVSTNRLIKILESRVYDIGPSWTYIDIRGNHEPHGYEKSNNHFYTEWYWHYCDALDFLTYNRYRFLSNSIGELDLSLLNI